MIYLKKVMEMKVKTIDFERVEGEPLYKQLYKKIRQDIIFGYLRKGDQLPSIRKCEQMLKLSKTSIEHAYQQLVEEGFLIAIPQKGYFIDVDKEHAMLRKQMLFQSRDKLTKEIRFDFRSQSVDRDRFDIALWKKYLKRILDGNEISTYGDAQGEKTLRIALQKYAYSVRGVLCDSEQMLVGSSFQSLLYILCGLLHTSCVIGMEESGFAQAETVFRDYHLTLRKLPSDENGICMRHLYDSDVRVLYINNGSHGSNHQPLCKTKREALLTWARRKNAYIIEDDHNGELRYHTKLTPAMQGFDMGKHVFYIGSFSKILLPSLRISYLVFTKAFQKHFAKRKDTYSPTSSKIEQLALAHYIADGHMERHVKRLRKRYERKSSYMERLLHVYFPQANCLLEEAALQFILRFPQVQHMDRFIELAKHNQILVQKTSNHELVLSFAAIKEEFMESALQELQMLWESCV